MSYLRGSSERGVVFRPGKGEMTVRVFVDAAYGVAYRGSRIQGHAW
jgi:hypothetical protein